MGTLWKLVLFSHDQSNAHAARDAVWAKVAQIEQALSDYREDSELNRFCRAGRTDQPGVFFREVLVRSLEIARETDGAFDPTVGPMVRLWRASRRTGQLPSSTELEIARHAVGWTDVKVRSGDGNRALFELAKPGMQLDFGGIAKGYGQDCALKVLKTLDISTFLIDAGGSVLAGDPPAGLPGWKIEIGTPARNSSPEVLWLKNASFDSSGDAHQFVEMGGRRYSHIVDPQTGLGLTNRIQASVIARDGTTADALSTAFCVMGEEKTRAFLKRLPHIEARLVVQREDGKVRVWETKGFHRWLRD